LNALAAEADAIDRITTSLAKWRSWTSMMTFAEIAGRWSWREIAHCPGRFVLSGGPSWLSPEKIASGPPDVAEYRVAGAKDPVVVTCFSDGGLISYRRPDGSFVHTLNTREGLERKLRALGIRLRARQGISDDVVGAEAPARQGARSENTGSI
jgi:hypothetical protein